MMQDHFEFTAYFENLLFYGWSSSTSAGVFAACVVMAGFAIILEAAKLAMVYIEARELSNPPTSGRAPSQASSDTQQPLHSMLNTEQDRNSNATKINLKYHLARTIVHLGRFVIGYFLMLGVMTYNAWFIIATVVGSGIGYFFFGSCRVVENADVLSETTTTNPSQASCHSGYQTNGQNETRELLDN